MPGSSVLIVTSRPASRIARNGCSRRSSKRFAMTTLLVGQTVEWDALRRPAAPTRAGSSTMATPWSIRSTPRRSRAIRMFSGPTADRLAGVPGAPESVATRPARTARRTPRGPRPARSNPCPRRSPARPGRRGAAPRAARRARRPARRPVRPVHVGDQHAPDAGRRLGRPDARRRGRRRSPPSVLPGREVAGGGEEHLAIAQPMGRAASTSDS